MIILRACLLFAKLRWSATSLALDNICSRAEAEPTWPAIKESARVAIVIFDELCLLVWLARCTSALARVLPGKPAAWGALCRQAQTLSSGERLRASYKTGEHGCGFKAAAPRVARSAQGAITADNNIANFH